MDIRVTAQTTPTPAEAHADPNYAGPSHAGPNHVGPTFVGPALLQVASASNPSSVAGAIAGMMRERGVAELQAIGAGAINQTVKAIAIARGYLAPGGIDLICVPAFVDVKINGEDRTAIKFFVEPRRYGS
ncbi:MAG: stage V sporulation protein S [Candidatus Sericytochromatia bacterium]|nr:stage V sporulation protein S [Candidatus Sericytochromatia bacterium]